MIQIEVRGFTTSYNGYSFPPSGVVRTVNGPFPIIKLQISIIFFTKNQALFFVKNIINNKNQFVHTGAN